MSIISHMGIDYDSPNIQIQDNPSATDLDNTKVPTGQTIKNYISNYIPKTAIQTITKSGNGNNSAISSLNGYYFKIGNLCYIVAEVVFSSTVSANSPIIINLPAAYNSSWNSPLQYWVSGQSIYTYSFRMNSNKIYTHVSSTTPAGTYYISGCYMVS